MIELKRRLLWRPDGMGHLGVTLADIKNSTLAELEELTTLLEAGHAAEDKARKRAEAESRRRGR